MGQIVLYEGNGGTQSIVATYSDSPHAGKVKPNDEARSLKLNNVREGCKITVYDNGSGNTNDDFCIIEVKKITQSYTVPTFERSYSDDTVQVSFVRNNGLDGKVSYIRIE